MEGRYQHTTVVQAASTAMMMNRPSQTSLGLSGRSCNEIKTQSRDDVPTQQLKPPEVSYSHCIQTSTFSTRLLSRTHSPQTNTPLMGISQTAMFRNTGPWLRRTKDMGARPILLGKT